jgi:hypothetical protein
MQNTESRFDWSKSTWEASVSSRCWWFTPYDAGWDGCKAYGGDIAGDGELKEIVRMEQHAAPIPAWAQAFVAVSVHLPAPCGHYSFPRPCLEAITAIGSGVLPRHVHGCYTADPGRKERMQDYLLCLDAWLKGAAPACASGELSRNSRAGIDWAGVCRALWDALGEPTTLKRLLVERTCHRYRWWVKTLTWDDDARDRFLRDSYLGDIAGDGDTYGHPKFKDPYTTEWVSPDVKGIEAALLPLDPDWKAKYGGIQDTWLCGPKSFRWLERIVWAIGKEKPLSQDDVVPGFLMCHDTLPDLRQAGTWWRQALVALDAWWKGQSVGGPVAEDINARLGEASPLKRWLVRLYARRLRMIAESGNLGKLIGNQEGCQGK